MGSFQQILMFALVIALGLLLYDKFVKPIGEALTPKTATPAGTSLEAQIKKILAEEAF